MKPKQLKPYLAAALACLLLFTASCSKPTGEAEDNSKWTNRDTWLTSGTASEQGYYYLQEDHFLSFFDFASQKSVCLCDKTGCTHRDGDCRAYMLFASPTLMFFHNDKLYFFEARQDGLKLTRRDADGGNYEEILTLMEEEQEPDATLSLTDYRVCGNLVYYIGSVLKNQGGGWMKGMSYLYQINLDSGKEEFLCEIGEDGGGLVAVREGQILLQQNLDSPKTPEELASGNYDTKEYLSSIPHKILLWEKSTGKLTTLLEDNRWNLLGAIAAYDDSYYVLRWDETHETNYVERHSLDGTEVETVFSPERKIANFSFPSNDELSIYWEDDKAWKNYKFPDFTEQALTLNKGDYLFYKTKDGYIIHRVLEYEGDLGFDFVTTKSAYSYLLCKDAEAGLKNYIDFYIWESDS